MVPYRNCLQGEIFSWLKISCRGITNSTNISKTVTIRPSFETDGRNGHGPTKLGRLQQTNFNGQTAEYIIMMYNLTLNSYYIYRKSDKKLMFVVVMPSLMQRGYHEFYGVHVYL